MKERLVGRQKGFSTLEIVIALAILSTVLSGVIAADFGNQYWVITSEAKRMALSSARVEMEEVRVRVADDFYSARSTVPVRSACEAGELCYYTHHSVADISPCFKYLEVLVSWQVPHVPTSTTVLPTYLSHPAEAMALGGDCALTHSFPHWTNPWSPSSIRLAGNPTGLDVLDGTVYVSESQSPYLQIFEPTAGNIFQMSALPNPASFYDIDVARHATGNTYAYIAASSTQFRVIDVSDAAHPTQVASSTLAGVSGTQKQGWRIMYYDDRAYITTLETAGPEFHIFNVSTPTSPYEVNAGVELGVSAYDMAVRDQYSKTMGGVRRFIYLATGATTREMIVLDVTPGLYEHAPRVVRTVDIPDMGCSNPPAVRSLALSGHMLYAGRESKPSACPLLPELYSLDVSDPYADVPIHATMIEVGQSVTSMRASGAQVFLGAYGGGRQWIEVRKSDALDSPPLYKDFFTLTNLQATMLDEENGTLYYIADQHPAGSSPQLRMLQSI